MISRRLDDRTRSEPRSAITQAEALEWLREHPAAQQSSVITSLPDLSELPHLGFEEWRSWFLDAARAVIRWLPSDGVGIFYQSDIRHEGAWVDKGHLVMRAADDERASLVWHKIVCRSPPGTSGLGRASYSHMLCLARALPRPMRVPSADVLAEAGAMSWSRAIGEAACQLACRYLRDETATRLVVDPFCGRGRVLAVASSLGFDVIGIDQSAKRCRAARAAIERAKPQGDGLRIGAMLFNQGRFFEAHEAWEDRWRAAQEETDRRFLQGLIQIAAALHKLFEMNDEAAALRLFGRGLAKLDACPERVAAVDLVAFRDAIRACASALARGEFTRASVPVLELDAVSLG